MQETRVFQFDIKKWRGIRKFNGYMLELQFPISQVVTRTQDEMIFEFQAQIATRLAEVITLHHEETIYFGPVKFGDWFFKRRLERKISFSKQILVEEWLKSVPATGLNTILVPEYKSTTWKVQEER